MSDARARANHELYLGKIVLGAWRHAIEQQDIPTSVLDQAFAGGARAHLVAAYGWFLLAVCQAQLPPDGPPRSCRELPAMPAGKVFPGEINEFRQLEAGGWLADLLRVPDTTLPVARQPDNLASAQGDLPGCEQSTRWQRELAALFDRMGNSLDEF